MYIYVYIYYKFYLDSLQINIYYIAKNLASPCTTKLVFHLVKHNFAKMYLSIKPFPHFLLLDSQFS